MKYLDLVAKCLGFNTVKGSWFADYFYPVRLGALKKVVGSLADALQAGMTKSKGSRV